VGPDLAALPVTVPGAQSSNTIVALGEQLFVKGYRRLQVGANPEVEIGRYLTDVVHFAHSVPVAGSVEYVAEDGRTATLALIQRYVQNQGSGWDYTLNYLDRFFEDTSREATTATGADVHGGYIALARTLGMRTAELHAAFAQSTGDPAFDPVPLAAAEVAAWTERVREEAMQALDRLERRRDALPELARADADRLLAQRDRLLARIGTHASDRSESAKTRLHGDYHLGQVLLVQNDFVVTDFEGEPSRTMAERTQKHSPLRDVAGMLRSFDYAMHAALFNFIAERPDTREAVEPAGRRWQDQAVTAFLEGYDEVARAGGLASVRPELNGLLELFVLEKALYELKYEVDNRPDWVRIPLTGLLDTLERTR
jgi:maltose alpha-D-glucosyltransferase/alpha-amylase